jgi:DNA-binding MarR family transcriptional regulator
MTHDQTPCASSVIRFTVEVTIGVHHFKCQVITGPIHYNGEVNRERLPDTLSAVTTDVDSDGTPWLDAEEMQAWVALVSILARLDAALDAQMRRDAGLRHFDYAVLAALSEAPDRTLRMSELAFLAQGSLSRLSQVVTRLENKGWVQRSPDPSDGRYTLAMLTDPGWAKVVAAAPGHVREVRRLVFQPLTRAQVRQLAGIGARIAAALSPNATYPPQPSPAQGS